MKPYLVVAVYLCGYFMASLSARADGDDVQKVSDDVAAYKLVVNLEANFDHEQVSITIDKANKFNGVVSTEPTSGLAKTLVFYFKNPEVDVVIVAGKAVGKFHLDLRKGQYTGVQKASSTISLTQQKTPFAYD